MKPNPSSPGAMLRYVAASLLLLPLPLTGQTLVNGNFDAQTPFGGFPGYVSGNTAITGWTVTPTNRAGLNAAGGPFAGGVGSPSGVIPSSPNVAFLQAGSGGPASMSQTVTDLTIGNKYNVSVRVSARNNGDKPALVFSTDGNGPTVGLDVQLPGANAAYRTAAFQFTATATSHMITFTNDRTSGDHTVLLDDVTVTAATSSSSWSFAPWTNDTVLGSGIDSSYVYTHAVNFGTNAPVTINGVNFIGRETGTTGRFALTEFGSVFNNVGHAGVTGNSGSLANDFRYGGSNTSISLQNLKPSTQYVFTAYGVGFDAAATYYRAATFSSSVPGSDKLTVNVNQNGQGSGIRVDYAYTTDSSGTPVVISLPATSPGNAGSWHTSGFSNREAVASTPPVLWTIQPWNDDASSGVSPNHFYTHAFKFGVATSFNLNGINFTGIAGGNPSGANYSSANMNPVFTNDTNNVTGFGSPLARDFVYDGFPAVHNLSGLTAGKAYVFTLYSVGWDNSPAIRPAAFIGGVGEQLTILNQDAYDNNNGVRFEYAYTATATTAKITVGGYNGGDSIHTYGISNREADPYVAKAPEFTLQPVGATIGIGTTYTLRGATIGSATMTYQWKKGINDISGETNPALVLNAVTAADSGAYTLVVTNGIGDPVTSNTANVAVLENVPAYGNTGLGVDGLLLAGGQIDPHFKLIANPDNLASDTVYVQSNLPGSWLANSGTSKWIGPRADSAGSAGIAADAGAGAGVYVYRTSLDLTGFTLSTVVVSGKWSADNEGVEIRVNGTVVGFPNATGVPFATLVPFSISNTTFPGLLTNGVNTVDFVVKNTDVATGFTGLRIDEFAAIGAIPPGTPPHIAVQPVGGNGKHNGAATLAVGASGSATLTYQWFKGVDPVLNATDPVLQLFIDDLTQAGTYKVRVTNGVTSVDSAPAVVTVTNANPSTVFDDAGATDEDVPLAINVSNLLANDSDADGDLVEFTSVSPTSAHGGTVTENLGVITYTPASGYSGPDSFTYTVNDGVWGGSTTEFVLITVNNVPNTPPGQMTLVLSGGVATGSFIGTPGETYLLQRSTTLEAGSWSTVDTEVAPLSGAVVVEDPSPPVGNAFYRISYTP